ncbi:pentatricopeptide repeat-containing protein At4g33170-like [Brassica napus]|uniref:pentatricopeptide repeat-containing protein At4g33170-like n=1 Tax=Brassica napus TaxID=3708 RepID=UPI0008731BB3|nr:pentatricopeptide repeat-containing protein At4g33170-like [Brassica napus]
MISGYAEDSAAYVLLSNMFAESGDWQERAKVRKLMEERKVKKEAGYSWMEVKNKTYVFLAGDRKLNHEEKLLRLHFQDCLPDRSIFLPVVYMLLFIGHMSGCCHSARLRTNAAGLAWSESFVQLP